MSLVPVISRRSFLKRSAGAGLAIGTIARGQTPIERGRFSEDDIPLAREQLLKMVNSERTHAGLKQVQLDDLACAVASEHARDMARGEFLSHWGTDGRKPYHRYSFAGGTDAVQENVSSADNIQALTVAGIAKNLHDMHLSMIEEVPPNDGHRKTILFPQHTHVGFGIATEGYNLRLDELYVARYVRVEPMPRQTRPRATVLMSGKVLNRNHILTGVELYYEPLPSPPAIEWLRIPRSYGMPEVNDRLLPRLPAGYSYPEGGKGIIEVNETGHFRVRVALSKKPGINTAVVWIRAGQTGTAFPASQICIRVE